MNLFGSLGFAWQTSSDNCIISYNLRVCAHLGTVLYSARREQDHKPLLCYPTSSYCTRLVFFFWQSCQRQRKNPRQRWKNRKMCWGARQRIDRQLSKLRFVSRLVVVYMKGNLVFYIMYGKFWFHGDFFDRNLDTSWNRSLSQRNFFFSWQNGTLSFFFGPGFFFYQGLVPPFDFSMSKDFSIGKDLPGVNFVECAGNIIKFEPSFK